MKKLFLLAIATFMLSGCVGVKDFGPYWDKGYKDKALVGTWKAIDAPTKDDPKGSPDTGTIIDDMPPEAVAEGITGMGLVIYPKTGNHILEYEIKTLNINSATYLMIRQSSAASKLKQNPKMNNFGNIVRYEIKDGRLITLKIDREKLLKYAADHHSKANFSTSEPNNIDFDRLDQDAIDLLGGVADTKEYWKAAAILEKASLPTGISLPEKAPPSK